MQSFGEIGALLIEHAVKIKMRLLGKFARDVYLSEAVQ